jgi:hypothetical protein
MPHVKYRCSWEDNIKLDLSENIVLWYTYTWVSLTISFIRNLRLKFCVHFLALLTVLHLLPVSSYKQINHAVYSNVISVDVFA